MQLTKSPMLFSAFKQTLIECTWSKSLTWHNFSPPSSEYNLEPCEDPGMPQFGQRNGYGFGIGDTLTFSCNMGYRLEGVPEVICLGGGRRMWSAPLPRCVGTWSPVFIPLQLLLQCLWLIRFYFISNYSDSQWWAFWKPYCQILHSSNLFPQFLSNCIGGMDTSSFWEE
jgi:hypothetical protein